MIRITVFKTSRGLEARIDRNGVTTNITMWELMQLPAIPTPRELKSAVVWAGFSESIAVHSAEVVVTGDVATWTDERELQIAARASEHNEVLRDQIAMQAITGCAIGNANNKWPHDDEYLYETFAKRAYELADAMLKAKEA